MQPLLTQPNINILKSAINYGLANSHVLPPGTGNAVFAMRDALPQAGDVLGQEAAISAFSLVASASQYLTTPEDEERELLAKLATSATADAIVLTARKFAATHLDYLKKVIQKLEGAVKAGKEMGLRLAHPILRDYQKEACENVIAAIREGKRGGLIVMPTGGGKTVTFVEIARRVMEEKLLNDKKTLILVHRKELAEQAQRTIDHFLGEGTASVACAGLKSRDLTGKIVIASVQTLSSKAMLEMLDPDDYGLVIVDETHHTVANTWRKLLEHMGLMDKAGFGIKSENKFLLGVTATPDRSDGVHLSVPFPDGLLFSKPLLWFILKGYLLRPIGVLVTTSAKLSEVKMRSDGDYNEDELGKEMSKEPVINDILNAYEEICPGEKTLMFASSVPHAHALAAAFNTRYGRKVAMAVDGKMENRGEVIKAHKRGEFDILINYGVLTEGYDDPSIQVVWLIRPTHSRSLYVQMVGRGLRIDPKNPWLGSVKIVDTTGSILDHEMDIDLAKLFGIEYVEDGLPPMDVVEATEQVQRIMNDEDARAKLQSGEMNLPSSLEHIEVSMLRQKTSPLAFFLYEKLFKKYQNDLSKMAWELGITEDCLTNYIAGQMPNNRKEVEKDFSNCKTVFEVEIDHILDLWQLSLQYGNVGDAISTVREVHERDPQLPLRDFFKIVAKEWVHKADFLKKDMEIALDDAPAALRQRLWLWEKKRESRGFNLDTVNEILDEHDADAYKRSQVKKDIEELTLMARERPITEEPLIKEAQRRGLLKQLPSVNGFYDFIELCEKKGLYTNELKGAVAKWKNMNALDIVTTKKFMRSYLDAKKNAPVTLYEYFGNYIEDVNLRKRLIPNLLQIYIFSDAPVENIREIVEDAKKSDIDIPFPHYLNGMNTDVAPKFYLISALAASGAGHPETLADIYEAEFKIRLYGTVAEVLRGGLVKIRKELPKVDQMVEYCIQNDPGFLERIMPWLRYARIEGWKDILENATLHKITEILPDLFCKIRVELKRLGQDYYENMMTELSKATGLSEQDILLWRDRLKRTGGVDDSKLWLPIKKPSTDAEKWLGAVRKGLEKCWSTDGVRDRQRKIKETVEAGGVNFENVLATVAGWDPGKVSKQQQLLIKVLFDDPQRCHFKRPKKSK